jgi:hypothetical protein
LDVLRGWHLLVALAVVLLAGPALAAPASSVDWPAEVQQALKEPARADVTYDAIRQRSREVRLALAATLRGDADSTLTMPPGPVRLDPQALRARRLDDLMAEVDTLNALRLTLLPALSAAKREAITGFSLAGLDQATAEAWHLALLGRYHGARVVGWLGELWRTGGGAGSAALTLGGVLLPWLLVLLGTLWWRRRGPGLLARWVALCEDGDRHAGRVTPGRWTLLARFVRDVQRQAVALLAWRLLVGALPAGARALLEVRVLDLVVTAVLVSSLLVVGANGVLEGRAWWRTDADAHGQLRVRSLRLVTGLPVLVWLLTTLTALLVGRGTIYHWVEVLASWAAAGVAFVLLDWWRPTIFRRLAAQRNKGAFQTWLLTQERGPTAIPSAALAGGYLLYVLVGRVGTYWMNSFETTRRIHAYLFRRELDQLERQGELALLQPLVKAAFETLSPANASAFPLAIALGDDVQLESRIAALPGGLIAVVSERGGGKSHFLKALASRIPGCHLVSARDGDAEAVLRTLSRQGHTGTVLIDDVHALVRPTPGGLEQLDRLLQARRQGEHEGTWVLALDSSVWPFVKRARGDYPTFDEVLELPPWPEEAIAALLRARSTEAGISPSFERLLDRTAVFADEIEWREALAARERGYFRLVWDYADGNPAAALLAWRASLRQDHDGQVFVMPLDVPEVLVLERLPDTVLFVFRSIVQLSPATLDELRAATGLAEDPLQNALRYGQTHGILAVTDGLFDVEPHWHRTVTRVLERRHMVVR